MVPVPCGEDGRGGGGFSRVHLTGRLARSVGNTNTNVGASSNKSDAKATQTGLVMVK